MSPGRDGPGLGKSWWEQQCRRLRVLLPQAGADQCFSSKCFGEHLLRLLWQRDDGHRVPDILLRRAVTVQGLQDGLSRVL